MNLRGKRYRGIIEIATDEEEIHDVLDEWQTLYTPPEGADPTALHMEKWIRLEKKPDDLPSHPIKGVRDVMIWRSELMEFGRMLADSTLG